MDRREFLRYAGAVTLDVIVSTSILSSVGCDDYSGYSRGSDEAKLIGKTREIIRSGRENKKEPPYIRHDINNVKSKHPLKFIDNYLVKMYPSGTGVAGILKSRGRAGIVYSICLDDCEDLKKLSKEINRPGTYIPEVYLSKLTFVEDVERKDWEPIAFKYLNAKRLERGEEEIFNKLKGRK